MICGDVRPCSYLVNFTGYPVILCWLPCKSFGLQEKNGKYQQEPTLKIPTASSGFFKITYSQPTKISKMRGVTLRYR